MAGDFAFDPETATVETGTPVNWTNTSDVGHTVTAYEDEEYRHTFEEFGTDEYFCIPHESSGMVGTVQVEPS